MPEDKKPIFKIFESPITKERYWNWRHFRWEECAGIWVFILRNDEKGECCYKLFLRDKGWYAFGE